MVATSPRHKYIKICLHNKPGGVVALPCASLGQSFSLAFTEMLAKRFTNSYIFVALNREVSVTPSLLLLDTGYLYSFV